MKRVKVLRSFFYEGKALAVGSVVPVSDSVCLEVCASNKAQLVKDEPAAAAPVSEEKSKRKERG